MAKKKITNQTIYTPPVVTVLGHVDHGKTTLLDSIRKTNIASREAGGITQHIGAYQVTVKPKGEMSSRASEASRKILRLTKDDYAHLERKITFIDTPGHEAFAKMRSRGASVSDIAVLVVAANDGVMPQTLESLSYIKEAKIPFVVAATKTDLPEANLEKIKQQLTKQEIKLEEYGGDVPFIPISAKSGKGIDKLLEMIILLAELHEVKPSAKQFIGVVIEAGLDKAKGPLATVIVKAGSITKGDLIVTSDGLEAKVRAMFDEYNREVITATVSCPFELLGLSKVPYVGTILYKKGDETLDKYTPSTIEVAPKMGAIIPAPSKEITTQKLKVVIKTDNIGSLEAILESLKKNENIEILSITSGNITESDILLAKSGSAIVIGFNVKPNSSVIKLAQSEKVMLKTYQIIYEMLDEIDEVAKALQTGGLEEVLGEAKILAIFDMKGETIAGLRVISGRIAKGDKVKIMRGADEIIRARIKTLRHQKEDITKAEQGIEAGATFGQKLDFLVNDSIIAIG